MDERLNYLKWALSDLIVDLTINTECFRDFISRDGFNPEIPRDHAKIRMVCSSLAINLSKLWELLNHFGKETNTLEPPLRNQCIEIKQKIESKGIYRFRSKYAAHIIDNETKLPLSLEEGEKAIKGIFGSTVGELDMFCTWVCPKAGEDKIGSVVGLVTLYRDYCKQQCNTNGKRP